MRTAVIVDDEPITRMDLSQMLEELGFRIAGQASDGFDAVELCRTHRPDVVLMDVRMPIFDGLSAAETIAGEEIAGCIVLLTAFSDAELIRRANEIGVTGYLVKPVEQRLLLPVIEVALAQSTRLRESRRAVAAAQQKLLDGKTIDRAKAMMAEHERISESEAYRRMQRMAMDKRCSLASLAAAVIRQLDAKASLRRAQRKLMETQGLSEQAAFSRIKEKAEQGRLTLEQAAEALAKEAQA